jgi:hypothetical protein
MAYQFNSAVPSITAAFDCFRITPVLLVAPPSQSQWVTVCNRIDQQIAQLRESNERRGAVKLAMFKAFSSVGGEVSVQHDGQSRSAIKRPQQVGLC